MLDFTETVFKGYAGFFKRPWILKTELLALLFCVSIQTGKTKRESWLPGEVFPDKDRGGFSKEQEINSGRYLDIGWEGKTDQPCQSTFWNKNIVTRIC